MTESYAVLWREAKGPICAGKLELGPRGLTLEGCRRGRGRPSRAIRYDDLMRLSMTRAPGERLHGKLTLVLELRDGEPIEVASVDGLGTIGELEERIGALVPRASADETRR